MQRPQLCLVVEIFAVDDGSIFLVVPNQCGMPQADDKSAYTPLIAQSHRVTGSQIRSIIIPHVGQHHTIVCSSKHRHPHYLRHKETRRATCAAILHAHRTRISCLPDVRLHHLSPVARCSRSLSKDC